MQWQKISKRILKRQIPHALLSWRYIMPKQTAAVKLHRKIFLNAWPEQSRATWILVGLYSYALWYLLYSWRHINRAWKKYAPALKMQEGISKSDQLVSLLSLALLHSIPPSFYYHYRLYAYPKTEWLEFIYTHELPHWHSVMSPKLSKCSKKLMSDKHLFSEHMGKRGLPSINTILCIVPGQEVIERCVFKQRSIFLKPRHGSAKEGCYHLLYDKDSHGYILTSGNTKPIHGKEKITFFLTTELKHHDYIIQPLLHNHPWFNAEGALITIRLVTAIKHNAPKSISATLEIPIQNDLRHTYLLAINCDSGKLIDTPSDLLHKKEDLPDTLNIEPLVNTHLPQWERIKAVAEKAHSECLDLATVGWDLALTTDGIKLLEGNINWGVYGHQRLDNTLIQNFTPML